MTSSASFALYYRTTNCHFHAFRCLLKFESKSRQFLIQIFVNFAIWWYNKSFFYADAHPSNLCYPTWVEPSPCPHIRANFFSVPEATPRYISVWRSSVTLISGLTKYVHLGYHACIFLICHFIKGTEGKRFLGFSLGFSGVYSLSQIS